MTESVETRKFDRRWACRNAINRAMVLWWGEAPEERTAVAKRLALTRGKALLRLKMRRAVVYRSAAARRVVEPDKSAAG